VVQQQLHATAGKQAADKSACYVRTDKYAKTVILIGLMNSPGRDWRGRAKTLHWTRLSWISLSACALRSVTKTLTKIL
jgi:hypothetical protein